MARILNRPMFRRGGSTNQGGGITGNLKKPRIGFSNAGPVPGAPDFTALAQQYMTMPEEPKGLSKSDYLRLAAAGAEIMGAQPTSDGSGFMAALSSAGPALSSAATDIAGSIDARKQRFDDKKSAYDMAMLGAATEQAKMDYDTKVEQFQALRDQDFSVDLLDKEQAFALDMLDKEHELSLEILDKQSQNEIKALIKQSELGIGILEKDFVTRKGNEAIEKANAAITAFENATAEEEKQKAIEEYKNIKNNFYNGLYGETTRANIEEKARLLADEQFTKLIGRGVNNVIDKEENKDPNSVFYNLDSQGIQEKIVDNLFNMVVSEIHFPEFPGYKKGGRVGMQEGGMATNPNMQEGASSADIQLTYNELRKRLPPEVSDGVIKLIMNSEEAMIDFAQLITPEDIAVFNDKYNVDLQYPTQVA